MAAVYLSLYVSLPLPISFFFLKEFNFSYGNICISVCEFMHAGAGVYRGQRHWISWSWSYRQLWAIQCRAFKPNLGPLQGQYILLTTKLSSHSFSLLKLLSEFYIYLLLFFNVYSAFSLCIYLSVYHTHVWYFQRPEGVVGSSGTQVKDGYEPPNPGLLQEQQMFLTTEPSFQPFHSRF